MLFENLNNVVENILNNFSLNTFTVLIFWQKGALQVHKVLLSLLYFA